MVIEDLNVKPCPMCGSKPRTWNWNHGAMVECWCKDHHIQCEAKTLEEALEAWNRRTDGIIRCKDCGKQPVCRFSQFQGNDGYCGLAERKGEQP